MTDADLDIYNIITVSHPLELHGAVYVLHFAYLYRDKDYDVENVDGKYVIYSDDINKALQLYMSQLRSENIDDVPDADVRDLLGVSNLLAKIGYYHGTLRYRIGHGCLKRVQCWQYIITFTPKPQRRVPVNILSRFQAWLDLVGHYWETMRIIPGRLEDVLLEILRDAHFPVSLFYSFLDELQAVIWVVIIQEADKYDVYMHTIPLDIAKRLWL
jgi:hypothetical protein